MNFLIVYSWLPSIIVGVLHLANYGVTAQKGLSFAEVKVPLFMKIPLYLSIISLLRCNAIWFQLVNVWLGHIATFRERLS